MKDRRLYYKPSSRNLAFRPAPSSQNLPINPDTGIVDFSKIKVGVETLTDAIIDTPLRKVGGDFTDKEAVLRAIQKRDIPKLRAISNFYYDTSGIYKRLCRYLAYLFRYDWYVVPYIYGGDTYPVDGEKGDIGAKDVNKILDGFFKTLRYLDNFRAKLVLGDIALKVVRNGCYYGYIVHGATSPSIQELAVDYCRSRYKKDNKPVVEFNMRYFDDLYTDPEYRLRVLKLFPDEFLKGYKLYKKGKLKGDYQGDTAGWYLLDPDYAFKVCINDDDMPFLISVIPAIIDLNLAQELDRKKMAQRLLKIIIQKLPLDKNGDLIFDPDEAQQLHNNAVRMLSRAIGIDVLTTFADVDVADMSDRNTTTTVDDLEKVERTVFNESGISQEQFNTDGNLALDKSTANDTAMMSNLINQFEWLMDMLLINFNKNPKKVFYKISILPTTSFDYKELSKMYKEQTQMGYSKMLPQIALGIPQSQILANAFFENDLLNLVTVFVPPLTSNTMNADALAQQQTGRRRTGITMVTGENPEGGASEAGSAGRPEKPDEEKSAKTIQNIESKS
jgi:hypothetical protein